MLSRYQIRVKVFHCLYANSIGNNLEKELETCFQSYLDLYHSILEILIYLKKRAEFEIEIGLNKKQPEYSDLNPNTRFINNLVLNRIEKDLFSKSFAEENLKSLSKKIFTELKEELYFQKYMKSENSNLKNDQKIIIKILQKNILSNKSIIDFFEEKSIYWNDDIKSAYNLFIYKNTELRENKKNFKFTQALIFKNQTDENFAKILFKKTTILKEKINKIIFKLVKNWDIERISNSDLSLLQLAITEINEFNDIPEKVTINEYIKISKEYCSNKSYEFINGILDNFIKKKSEFEDINKQ